MRSLFLGALFLSSSIFCDLKDPNVHAVTEGDPTVTICDCVNVLTGDFIAFRQDLVVEGIEPIYLRRIYMGGDNDGNYGGWEFFPHLILKQIPHKVKEGKGKDFRRVRVAEPNGSVFTYKLQEKSSYPYPTYLLDFEKHGKGVTNLSQGILSGRTNLKNQTILQISDNVFKVMCASGGERWYHKISGFKTNPRFLLKKEKLPNGNQIFYKYDEQDRLTHISTTNATCSKVYTSCCFSYYDPSNKKKDFDVQTSDGRVVSYRFSKKLINEETAFVLQSVMTPLLPEESESYIDTNDNVGFLLHRRTLPDGRFIQADYYCPRIPYNVYGTTVKIPSEDDPRTDRVKALQAPVGTNGNLVATHQFIYNISRGKKENNKYTYWENGLTQVFDAYGNKTEIRFVPHFLPIEIKQYEGSQLHHWISIDWQSHGEMTKKIVRDAEGKELFHREYTYDHRGNVIEERCIGEITGSHCNETRIIRYAYDANHFLIRQEDPNGKISEFQYLPNTDLISAKLISDQKEILLREFYIYDADRLLIQMIQDNGKSRQIDDLLGVTERRIKNIIRKSESPAIGFPEVIEEKALDLATMQERLMKTIRLTYSKEGHVCKKEIFDADGAFVYKLNASYDSRGRPIEESNALGEITRYYFDVHGNHLFQENPSGSINTFIYDAANRLIREEEKNKEGIVRTIEHEYDFKNNRISTKDHFGNQKQCSYDVAGHLTKITYPQIHINPNSSPVVMEEHFSVDVLGRVTSKTDGKGNTSKWSYNIDGNPLEMIHPDGSKETFRYNIDGTLASHINQEGVTTKYTYDVFGRQTSKTILYSHDKIAEETYFYDAFHLLAKRDYEGILTSYTYDCFGRQISEVKETQRKEFFYDALSNLKCIKHLNGKNTLLQIMEKDALDRIIEEREEDSSGTALSKICYQYDSHGNQQCIIRFHNNQETKEWFIYDAFNRLTKHVDPLGRETLFFYDESHRNALGQKVLQKITLDPAKNQTIETYNAIGKLASLEKKSQSKETIFFEEYFYDVNGNLTTTLHHLYANGNCSHTYQSYWAYDACNRLKTHVEDGKKATHYFYTSGGRLARLIKPDGVSLFYTYDALGNLISLKSSDETVHYTYAYNSLGKLFSAKDWIHDQTTIRHLDVQGNLLQETLGNGLTLQNTYDCLNRRTKLLLPNGNSIQYTFDAKHLRDVTYHKPGGSFTHSYTGYDLAGNSLTEELLGHLGTIEYSCNSLGRMIDIKTPFFSQSIQAWDKNDNVISFTTQDRETKLGYDALNQLIFEKGIFSHRYTYDSLNNRLVNDGDPFFYQKCNQMLSSSFTSFKHDQNGNPIKRKTRFPHKGSIHLVYDALDRLTEGYQEEVARVTFVYDGLNRRLSKTFYTWEEDSWKESYTQHFFYDNMIDIGSTNQTGKIVELRVLGRLDQGELGSAVLMEIKDRLYVPIHDLQGNVAQLISLNHRSIQEIYHYSTFGQEILNDHHDYHRLDYPPLSPWRFASKRKDMELNLIYFGGRYYDPEVGRWLTPNPSGYIESRNAYAFADNNPMKNRNLYQSEFHHNFEQQQADKDILSSLPEDFDNEYEPKNAYLLTIQTSQRTELNAFSWMQTILPSNLRDPSYFSFRNGTKTGAGITSLFSPLLPGKVSEPVVLARAGISISKDALVGGRILNSVNREAPALLNRIINIETAMTKNTAYQVKK